MIIEQLLGEMVRIENVDAWGGFKSDDIPFIARKHGGKIA